MLLILVSVISCSAGLVIGFLSQKFYSQKIIIEKEVLAREVELLKAQADNFEKFREESLKSAKAVMVEASAQVSAKLLDDHKRENLESRKVAEEVTQKTTEKMFKDFQGVVEKVAALDSNVKQQDSKVSTIWQTLASPTTAGAFAELGLENMLKNFGLEKDRDFFTQFSAGYQGQNYRPDAVIKLSDDNLIVIDAKTSKLFLELNVQNANEAELLEKLKNRMAMHLRDLSSKDYGNAVRREFKCEHGHIINVMYIPSDSHYARVLQADNQFAQKCMAKNIHLADPSRIEFILNVARYNINRAKQEANHRLILKEMGNVVSSVDNFIRGLDEIGRSIKRTADHFSKLSGAVNSRLLPRIRKVISLGLEPEKELKLPENLPNFNIIENQTIIIEAESSEASEPIQLFDKKVG